MKTDAEIRGKGYVHWKSWQETGDYPPVEALCQVPDSLRFRQRERHEHRPPPAEGGKGDGGPGVPAEVRDTPSLKSLSRGF